jgi:outer membrane protein
MRNRLVLLGVLLFAGVMAYGQQPMKFGHINTQEVLNSLPELKAIQTQMETEYKQKEDQLTTMQADLKSQQDEYVKVAETMPPAARAEKEKSLQELGQKVQNYYMLAQQQLKAREQELKMPLVKKVQTAIQEVGDENGFLYIFETASNMPLYRSEKSIDVTPLVLVKMGITTTK